LLIFTFYIIPVNLPPFPMASMPRPSTKSSAPTTSGHSALALTKPEQEILLLIYIHGFKGADDTFAEFPERLEHILSETIPHVKVESLIFPAYEVMSLFLNTPKSSDLYRQTKGELVSIWGADASIEVFQLNPS
jgi:hypothetical protein